LGTALNNNKNKKKKETVSSSHNNMYIWAKDLVNEKIKLEDVSDLYILLEDRNNTPRLAEAVNMLAENKGYRVVSSHGVVHSEIVIMKKKEEEEEEEENEEEQQLPE
jgi:hypothetical protein